MKLSDHLNIAKEVFGASSPAVSFLEKRIKNEGDHEVEVETPFLVDLLRRVDAGEVD